MKTHTVPKKTCYAIKSIEILLFGLKGDEWDLLMMRSNYKLTKKKPKNYRIKKRKKI